MRTIDIEGFLKARTDAVSYELTAGGATNIVVSACFNLNAVHISSSEPDLKAIEEQIFRLSDYLKKYAEEMKHQRTTGIARPARLVL